MRITIASSGDFPKMCELCAEWAKEKGHDISEKDMIEEMESINKSGRLILFKDDHSIVGFAGLLISKNLWDKKLVAHEKYIFISKPYRGKIGRLLVTILENFAAEFGCSALAMYPNKFGGHAERWMKVLKRDGFDVVGYQMEKKLNV
jgi:hypothetical protein